ncbi:MAG: hypothetical protein HUJ52_00380 [Malacoplasma sp.]|nr:hypothetical protein [Malacoplasma sp.]
MKKMKLLTSLTSLGALIVATPIVATSCSKSTDVETNDFDLVLAQNFTGKIAQGGRIDLSFFCSKDQEMVEVDSLVATSDNANVSCSTSVVYYACGVSIEATLSAKIGTKFSVSIEAKNTLTNKKATKTFNMTVVEHDYQIETIAPADKVEIKNVNDTNGLPSTVALFQLTDAGNYNYNFWNSIKYLYVSMRATIETDIYNCKTNKLVTDGSVQAKVVATDISYYVFGPSYLPVRFYALSNALPGEYKAQMTIKIDGIELASTDMNFNVVPGVDVPTADLTNCSFGFSSISKALLPGDVYYPVDITDIAEDATLKLNITPEPLESEEVTYAVEAYGITKTLPDNVKFDETDANMLIIPADTISDELQNFQCKVTISVNGVKQASILLDVREDI